MRLRPNGTAVWVSSEEAEALCGIKGLAEQMPWTRTHATEAGGERRAPCNGSRKARANRDAQDSNEGGKLEERRALSNEWDRFARQPAIIR